MTQKQFKEILTNAGYKFDYASIAIKLERLAWLEAHNNETCPILKSMYLKDARTLHDGITAAGVYDGFEERLEKALAL